MKINKEDINFLYSIYHKIRYRKIMRIHEKIVTGSVWNLMNENDKTEIEKAYNYGWKYVERSIADIFGIKIILVKDGGHEKSFSKDFINLYNKMLANIGTDDIEWLTKKYASNLIKKLKNITSNGFISPYEQD